MATLIEGIWDEAIDGIRRLIEQAQAQAEERRQREQRVVELTASSGNRFRIEPDQVPQVIADLQSALGRIRDIRWQAQTIANTEPPGMDEVSRNAARMIGEMAMGSEGSLKAALDAYELEITKTIAGLEDDLRTYLGTEEVNVPPPSVWP